MKRYILFLLGILYRITSYSAKPRYHFMLTRALFAVSENGWFVLGCKAFDAEVINKAISDEANYNAANHIAVNKF